MNKEQEEKHVDHLILILEQLLNRAKKGTYHGKGYKVKMQLAMDILTKIEEET